MENLRAQFVFPCAAAIGRPVNVRIANLTGSCKVRQFPHRLPEHCFVTLAILRWSKSTSHRVIDKHRAWRRDLGKDIEHRADDQSRNAAAFNHMRNETDGLMAERSIRYEQGQIDADFF